MVEWCRVQDKQFVTGLDLNLNIGRHSGIYMAACMVPADVPISRCSVNGNAMLAVSGLQSARMNKAKHKARSNLGTTELRRYFSRVLIKELN